MLPELEVKICLVGYGGTNLIVWELRMCLFDVGLKVGEKCAVPVEVDVVNVALINTIRLVHGGEEEWQGERTPPPQAVTNCVSQSRPCPGTLLEVTEGADFSAVIPPALGISQNERQ
jgi:hypothetical protein